jgi:hypothetical protein
MTSLARGECNLAGGKPLLCVLTCILTLHGILNCFVALVDVDLHSDYVCVHRTG